MKKRRRKASTALKWAGLANLAGEMMLSSAFVIDHRVKRMSGAGSKPSAADRREMTRMVQEKVEAAQEAGLALSRLVATPGFYGRGNSIHSVAEITGKMLYPFARRAKANAKRLAKKAK